MCDFARFRYCMSFYCIPSLHLPVHLEKPVAAVDFDLAVASATFDIVAVLDMAAVTPGVFPEPSVNHKEGRRGLNVAERLVAPHTGAAKDSQAVAAVAVGQNLVVAVVVGVENLNGRSPGGAVAQHK